MGKGSEFVKSVKVGAIKDGDVVKRAGDDTWRTVLKVTNGDITLDGATSPGTCLEFADFEGMPVRYDARTRFYRMDYAG